MNLQRGQDGKSNENGGEMENRQYKRSVEKRMEEGGWERKKPPPYSLKRLGYMHVWISDFYRPCCHIAVDIHGYVISVIGNITNSI